MGKKFIIRLYRAGEEAFLSAEVDSLADARRWAQLTGLAADKYEVYRGPRMVARYNQLSGGRWVRTHEEVGRG